MKLSVDRLVHTLEFTLLDEPAPVSKELVPLRLVADFTEDGRLARLLLLGLNAYPGGDRVSDIDLDLTPTREYTYAGEVDSPHIREVIETARRATVEARLKQALAEVRPGDITDPAVIERLKVVNAYAPASAKAR